MKSSRSQKYLAQPSLAQELEYMRSKEQYLSQTNETLQQQMNKLENTIQELLKSQELGNRHPCNRHMKII